MAFAEYSTSGVCNQGSEPKALGNERARSFHLWHWSLIMAIAVFTAANEGPHERRVEAPAARPPDPLSGRLPGLRAGAPSAPLRMERRAGRCALGGRPGRRQARRRGPPASESALAHPPLCPARG